MLLLLITALGCSPWSEDLDGDGYTAAQGDCDERSSAVHPGASDLIGDLRDTNCDGVDGQDVDQDGAMAAAIGGPDCDDSDPSIHPWAAELCDGIDNDCDGEVEDPRCGPVGEVSLAAARRFVGETTFHEARQLAALGDVDGDGLGDVLVGARNADFSGGDSGSVWLLRSSGLLGAATPVASLRNASARLDGTATLPISRSLRTVGLGDMDGDGLGDAALVGGLTNSEEDATWILSSQDPGWLSGTHPISEVAAARYDADVSRIRATGDVNGDALADLLLIDSQGDTRFVYLLYGSSEPLPPSAALEAVIGASFTASEGEEHSNAAAGDLDGDGLADLVIRSRFRDGVTDESGGAYLIAGGSLADAVSLGDGAYLSGGEGDELGWQMASGDVDGDGRDDVVLTREGAAPGVVIIPGDPDIGGEVDALSAAWIDLAGEDFTGLSLEVSDLNRDGRAELLVGLPRFRDDRGEENACWIEAYKGALLPAGGVWISYGPLEGAVTAPDAWLRGEPGQSVGRQITGVGDVDGDGWPDLMVGALESLCWSGSTWLVPGGPR